MLQQRRLRRPVWQRLRELAPDALRVFGWESTVVEPFVEIEPGVWRRRPSPAEQGGGSGPARE